MVDNILLKRSGIYVDASLTDTDVSNFDGKLSNADDTVQKALDTLDDHTHTEDLAHADLSDMPDTGGTNTDHDVRNDARFLKIDGSNANSNINIGSYSYITNGGITINTIDKKIIFRAGTGGGADGGYILYNATKGLHITPDEVTNIITFGKELTTFIFDGDVIKPATTNNCDLGTLTKKFKDAYIIGTLYGDDYNITIDNVANHLTDNSQAHSDYLINNGNDITTGTLKINSDITISSGSIISDTGAISFGNENLTTTGTSTATRFISNIAIGTSPYTCTSTTLNTNLNADFLDGQHGTYYVDIVNDTSPQLGGTLDCQENNIDNVGDIIHDDATASDFTIKNEDLNKDIIFYVNDGGNNKDVLTLKGATSSIQGDGSTASGNNSLAIGGGTASSNNSVAFGGQSVASGPTSFAIGGGTAAGASAVAMGDSSTAGSGDADGAFAMGAFASALGTSSFAMGHGASVTAGSNSGFAIGAVVVVSEEDGVAIGKNFTNSTNLVAFGNGKEQITLSTTKVVFNEPSNDVDFIIEGGTEDKLFYLDAGNDNIRMGDYDTNYAQFAKDGELTLVGTARVKRLKWVGAEGLRAPGLKPATFISHGIKGAWQFADATAANQETVSGTVKIPHDMDMSVAPSFYIGWSADGISPGNCEWQFEYLWVTANDDTTAAAQETLTVTSTASATSNGLIVVEVTGIDVPNASDKAMFWRIKRLSASGNDTISDTVEMHGNFFEYTANKLGEAT